MNNMDFYKEKKKMSKKEKRQFEVNIHFSSVCTYTIEAEDEEEAILKARELELDENEILSNLESWYEADTAEQIE